MAVLLEFAGLVLREGELALFQEDPRVVPQFVDERAAGHPNGPDHIRRLGRAGGVAGDHAIEVRPTRPDRFVGKQGTILNLGLADAQTDRSPGPLGRVRSLHVVAFSADGALPAHLSALVHRKELRGRRSGQGRRSQALDGEGPLAHEPHQVLLIVLLSDGKARPVIGLEEVAAVRLVVPVEPALAGPVPQAPEQRPGQLLFGRGVHHGAQSVRAEEAEFAQEIGLLALRHLRTLADVVDHRPRVFLVVVRRDEVHVRIVQRRLEQHFPLRTVEDQVIGV